MGSEMCIRDSPNRGLTVDFEVLQRSTLVEIAEFRGHNKTKENLKMNVKLCTSLADGYSASQPTLAREIEGRS